MDIEPVVKALVLVADNDEKFLLEMREMLEEAGLATATQLSARCVMEDFRRLRPSCVVLDLVFPDGSGIDLLRELKEEAPEVPVLLLTGEGYNVRNAIEAVRHGAIQFLEKPVRRGVIVQSVRMALDAYLLRQQNDDLWRQSLEGQGVVGNSPGMLQVMRLLRRVADLAQPILIMGESGTGKSMLAEAIHKLGSRRSRPFYTIDFSLIPRNLFHSELFGHRRGAFTGAVNDKPGLVEMAKGGTLFLDEIQDLSLEVQGPLKQFIERRRFTPVGGMEERTADTRLILATNRDLAAMVRDGSFQHDLFERINVFPIRLPNLNERKEDLPLLAERILRAECREMGKPFLGFDAEALFHLQSIDYRNRNIRRLKTLIQRAVVLAEYRAEQPFITQHNIRGALALDGAPASGARLQGSFRDLMAAYKLQLLQRALEEEGGSKTRAAKALGLSLDNFCKKLKGGDEA